MTLTDYQTEWENDARLKLDALDEEAQNTPYLHAKWWKYYSSERLKYKKLQFSHKRLYRQRWEWYAGKMDDEERISLKWPIQPLTILSQNLPIYLEADPLLQQSQAKLTVAEETLRFLEDVIKQINNRNFQIKSAIDFLKFKMGV